MEKRVFNGDSGFTEKLTEKFTVGIGKKPLGKRRVETADADESVT